MENNESKTPLLIACEREDVSLDLVQMLVDADRAVLRLRGGYGSLLPIHSFFEHFRQRSWCIPLVRFLIESAPDTLDVREWRSCQLHSISNSMQEFVHYD